jgi:hypothetical protein
MAEHHRKPRSGNRHANKTRALNPDEALWDEAKEALQRDMGWSMIGWFNECLKFITGRRKTFPPRPQWAEERAAALPDDDPIRPDDATDT